MSLPAVQQFPVINSPHPLTSCPPISAICTCHSFMQSYKNRLIAVQGDSPADCPTPASAVRTRLWFGLDPRCSTAHMAAA